MNTEDVKKIIYNNNNSNNEYEDSIFKAMKEINEYDQFEILKIMYEDKNPLTYKAIMKFLNKKEYIIDFYKTVIINTLDISYIKDVLLLGIKKLGPKTAISIFLETATKDSITKSLYWADSSLFEKYKITNMIREHIANNNK